MPNSAKDDNGLTELQEKFCQEFVFGEKRGDKRQSAIRAGYAQASAVSWVMDLLKNPNINKRITELEREWVKHNGIYADKTIINLMLNSKVDSVKLQAALAVRESAGLKLPEKHEVTFRTEEEIDRELHMLLTGYQQAKDEDNSDTQH